MKMISSSKRELIRGMSAAAMAVFAGCTCCGPKEELLFGERLEKADYDPAVWYFDTEGNLTAKSDQAIWTKCGDWENFELDLEYNLDPAANSGILVYCTDRKDWIPNAVEVQLMDDYAEKWAKDPAYLKTGSLYGHLAPIATSQKPTGEWNRAVLTARGSLLTLVINGVVVQDNADLSKMTDAKKNPDGSTIPPWLSRPWADLPTKGFIGLQGKHAGATVRFRNIRVRKL